MATPYDAPSLRTLYDRVTADIQGAMQRSPYLLMRLLRLAGGAAMAGASWGLHKAIEAAAVQGLPSTATGSGLDGWGQVGGRDRNGSTRWSGVANVYAAGLSVVTEGDILTRRGDSETYRVTATVTWGAPAAYKQVAIEAVNAGTNANMDAGDLLWFASPAAGVNANTYVYSVTAYGTEAEDDDTYRPEVIAGAQGAGQKGGTKEDYEAWAGAVAGVFSAVATSPTPGYVTVTVAASDGATPPGPAVPDAGLLSDVEAALALVSPVDDRVTVAAWSA